MLNIKSLITGVTAAAFVSAIGLAYAQTATNPATPGDSTTPAANSVPAPMQPAAPTASSDTSMPNASPSRTTSGTLSSSAEPAPKADRN